MPCTYYEYEILYGKKIVAVLQSAKFSTILGYTTFALCLYY